MKTCKFLSDKTSAATTTKFMLPEDSGVESVKGSSGCRLFNIAVVYLKNDRRNSTKFADKPWHRGEPAAADEIGLKLGKAARQVTARSQVMDEV